MLLVVLSQASCGLSQAKVIACARRGACPNHCVTKERSSNREGVTHNGFRTLSADFWVLMGGGKGIAFEDDLGDWSARSHETISGQRAPRARTRRFRGDLASARRARFWGVKSSYYDLCY